MEPGLALLSRLFGEKKQRARLDPLYGAIVAAGRAPAWYVEGKVPDTVEGRFDMIVLHLALLVRRTRREDEDTRKLAQQVFDRFCTDLDHNLREMGVGEMAVPRRMRKFGEAFYGRAAAYDAALDSQDVAALDAALARNLRPSGGHVPELAGYVVAAEGHLASLSGARIRSGELSFPDPVSGLALHGE